LNKSICASVGIGWLIIAFSFVVKWGVVDVGQWDFGSVAGAELFVLKALAIVEQACLVAAPEVRVSGKDAWPWVFFPAERG
jgi:hypothetical protein